MPSPGTIVRLADDRIAIVSAVSPEGDADYVLLPDGQEESASAWDVEEILTEESVDESPDEEPPKHDELLARLHEYIRENG